MLILRPYHSEIDEVFVNPTYPNYLDTIPIDFFTPTIPTLLYA